MLLPVALGLATLAMPANAASITLGEFTFSEAAGTLPLRGERPRLMCFRIFQTVTGPDVDLFMSIEGLLTSNFLGFRFESVLTNLTDTPWVFFDHELQETLGTPALKKTGCPLPKR